MPRKNAESSSKAAPETLAQSRVAAEVAELSFEQAIDALEGIVARMESGELELQASLEAYERGAALVNHCRTSLENARLQVKVFEEGLLRPYQGEDNDAEPT